MKKFIKNLNTGNTYIDFYLDGMDVLFATIYIDKDTKYPPVLLFKENTIDGREQVIDAMEVLKEYMAELLKSKGENV